MASLRHYLQEWENGDTSPIEPAQLPQSALQRVAEMMMREKGPLALWKFMFDISSRLGYLQPERLALDILYEESRANAYDVPLQISINCSKPEIVAPAAPAPASAAPTPAPAAGDKPQCVICYENVASAAKPGLRAYVFELNGRDFFMQYPPYPYTTGHAVVIEKEHTRQIINANTSKDLLEFVDMFPSVYIASNTDKSGTGASVLAHRHYQAAQKRLAVFDAHALFSREHKSSSGHTVRIDALRYPCVALRLTCADSASIQRTILSILHAWREVVYQDMGLVQDDQTMSYFVHKPKDGDYEVIMIPRNRTHMTKPELHCIKKEFVGVLEMAGYAVLPGRLDKELKVLSDYLWNSKPLPAELAQYAYFVENHYKPARTQCATATAEGVMRQAMYTAFAEIIADNSAYDSADQAATQAWLDAAFAGPRRYSIMDAIGSVRSLLSN